ncbi:phosphate ABC transporter substrate-binding protein PstS [Galbitalea sp. SE-J8]|uniref:phosphate ABC transporter substrate-binding protein PstS n=1 Tax=Galbitalea sp. SE-J8 TaxID=3054952 RepID=UPI00259C8408|nr:phosphate ABC transporter substrate-binding protein PstS [Galbitalea sp. SE-J8]MDM4761759.1 phosphate ABC transporter substrate-binding protein PstS [Galbitalea sp. SE-J8]
MNARPRVRFRELGRSRGIALGLIAAVVALVVAPAASASAESYVPVSGAGSSWSSNAIDQWRRNVQQFGMRINYASTGSSDGRNQFKAGTVDFAVSEIPYSLTDGGVFDSPPTVGYAYMPIVAGGTAFMYNLEVGGKRVTNLRLSGEVITKIFTGVITSWDDPAIAKDNPGLTLPKRQIVPVVRSDGSGSTAQFTTWMGKKYGSLWDAYCAQAGRSTPCGVTSNYPTIPGKGFIAQPNSQGVSGYVAQKANVGTITYVEYSYALKTGFPVAKVLNAAGYYVEPTASNVAVGLLAAKINTDQSSPQYLTQILDGVYDNKDARTYPLSSYSYMILPTSTATNFTNDKGKTLGAFAYYFLCEGQQQAEVLGYSPLPINLVKAGLEQVARIPGVDTQSIDIAKCNNPTFSKDGTNTLATSAKQPQACDEQGTAQCPDGTGGAAGIPTEVKGGASAPATSAPTQAPGSGGATGGSTGGGSGGGSGSPGDGGSPGSAGGGTTDGGTTTEPGTSPDTGTDAGAAPVDPGTTVGGAASGTGNVNGVAGGPVQCEADTGTCVSVASLPVEVASSTDWSPAQSLMLGAVVALLALVVVPPLIGLGLSRRKGSR